MLYLQQILFCLCMFDLVKIMIQRTDHIGIITEGAGCDLRQRRRQAVRSFFVVQLDLFLQGLQQKRLFGYAAAN